jgi:predicted aconitase
MRAIVFALLAACGSDQKPLLNGVPQPPAGAVAGVAAAAAAAITLANPNAATPEKRDDQPQQEVEVKEHVTGDVLDRLDKAEGSGSATATAEPAAAKSPKKKPKGKAPKIPSPAAAAAQIGPANDQPDAVPAR